MIDYKLSQEFEDIKKTRFWKEYVQKLDMSRDTLTRLLCTVKIGEPAVRGDIYQENIRLINQIINLPEKMIGKEDDNG
jgi:hypothetical protein